VVAAATADALRPWATEETLLPATGGGMADPLPVLLQPVPAMQSNGNANSKRWKAFISSSARSASTKCKVNRRQKRDE
jgi:hypothetical protein